MPVKNPLVSVIMPVYNPGQYFRAAVDSVLAQTLTDFELLLIDDGSADGSGAVCDEYAARDPRVRVKHGRNGGICASRNVGMDMACGEWLAFCDHDDRYEPIFLERLSGAVVGTDHVVVTGNRRFSRRYADGSSYVTREGYPRASREWELEKLFDDVEEFQFYSMALTGSVWNCLVKRDFVRAHRLDFNTQFRFGSEDFDFLIGVFAAARRGLWVEDVVYCHYTNVGTSTSSVCHPELLNDYLATALRERSRFPPFSPAVQMASFSQWAYMAISFVLLCPGNRFSMRERVRWVGKYHRELAPREAGVALALKFGWKKAVLALAVDWHLLPLYFVGKIWVRKARFILKGDFKGK